MNQAPECHMLRLSLAVTTPDPHSNPERGSGGEALEALVGLWQCAHKDA